MRAGEERIDKYIWHHNQVTGRIELVKEPIHKASRHTGGKALWGGGKENR
ncbi:HNH endonuclease [Clostridium sp. OS1-26]|nr:HNH endonuclease [Clostridium sp. OS1-26]WML37836.1 HNH endonuclease [Clostridium sp. OS1-26]